MDKNSVILKYEQCCAAEAEAELENLRESNENQEKLLIALQEKMGRLGAVKTIPSVSLNPKSILSLPKMQKDQAVRIENYDDLFAVASSSLIQRGLSTDELDYNDLVSDEDLAAIVKELNTPLPREEIWQKSDFVVTFIAAFVGCIADIVLSNRNNSLTGEKSKLSDKLNDLHEKVFKHKPGAPIDYQGAGFGGGHHRELSKGHDLARFVDGIKMFKEGKFEGVVFENEVKKVVSMTSNQYGTPYEQLPIIGAIVEYSRHMFADVFSTYSLPFPGYSFLRESDSRQIRKLAADMYNNGFNIKNVMTQSLSVIIIEIIIRLYYSIKAVHAYSSKVVASEDFSYLDAAKEFINPQQKEKLNEMLLVAHSIVMAENTGKIVFKCLIAKDIKAVSEINIAEIISVVGYGIKVVNAAAARNNAYAKLIYHADEINKQWDEIGSNIEADELLIIEGAEPLLIG